MHQVRFAFVVHDHQPVGNFESVLAQAYEDGYLPFLTLLEQHPWFKVTVHTSGPLLEWLLQNRPEYIERVKRLVHRGQVEILGGAYYEPILTMIPPHDRRDQITLFRRRLESLFDTVVDGIWLAERVWEPSLANDLAQVGVRYTLLDDFHFRVAGLTESELDGYYVTEDNGMLLHVFPISERLRYLIPFRDPWETIEYCAGYRHKPGVILVFGDDGEKFGVWPETRKHVYEDRWLERFLEALEQNLDWLRLCTLQEILHSVPPKGKIYLPDCSYREMTEWALPPQRARTLMELERELQHHPRWSDLRSFIRGGSWRNFKVKYPETNEMYCRMLEVSERLQLVAASSNGEQTTVGSAPEPSDARLAAARDHLFRAQCNCAYWHGWFGGLYLPHLRHAVFHHLIAADRVLDALDPPAAPVQASSRDFNLDSRQEVKLENRWLAVYLAPARGGHIYELDVKAACFNLAGVVSRRPEVYHDGLAERLAADEAPQHLVYRSPDSGQPVLVYDAWRRAIAVDHALPPGTSLDELATNRFRDLLGHSLGVYMASVRKTKDRIECVMKRRTSIGEAPIELAKTVRLLAEAPVVEIEYQLTPLGGPPGEFILTPEFAIAALAGHTPDRYLLLEDGRRSENLGEAMTFEACSSVSIVDEHMGLAVQMRFSEEVRCCSVPLETVSQSEAGYERVFQGVVLYPMFPLDLTGERPARCRITVGVSAQSDESEADTTAADRAHARASGG